jgi:predicted ribosome quality control (RQC) complex YloA/Tae2 family protein
MQVDALTLAAVVEELRAGLIGARVDDVIQPTPQAIALQCYGGLGGEGSARNRWLLASAHPQVARLHLIERKPRKLVTEPPTFVMLLRKYLEGTRLREVRQPRWERIVEFGFAHGPSDEHDEAVWLVVEIMGQLSNLILRDEGGMILGALRQVGLEKNHYRALAPHVAYRSPPPQTRTLHGEPRPRLAPETLTGDDLRAAAEEIGSREPAPGRKRQPPTVATVLTDAVAGWGRDLATESLARADMPSTTPLTAEVEWGAVVAAVHSLAALYGAHAWQPTLVYAPGEPQPRDAAVYRPVRFPAEELHPAPSVNDLLATYFEDAEWRGAVDTAKADLRHLLKTQHDRTRRKAEALAGDLGTLDEAKRLRTEADLLLAFQGEVPPNATSFTRENPFAVEPGDPPTLSVSLDPRLSAVQNANRLYARYHKLQRAGAAIPPQIEANAVERARIEQLQTDLALAETPAEIALVRSEVVEAGYLRPSKTEKPAKQAKSGKNGKFGKGGKGGKPGQQRRAPDGGTPLRRTSSDGFTLLVGKNSRQNEEVTFGQAAANDTWLHARGVPGAHVIVKASGRPIPDATLREAAALAAYYSQARAAGSVPVDYTQQRYVRHIKGGGPGLVTYERERTLHVAPEDHSVATSGTREGFPR